MSQNFDVMPTGGMCKVVFISSADFITTSNNYLSDEFLRFRHKLGWVVVVGRLTFGIFCKEKLRLGPAEQRSGQEK